MNSAMGMLITLAITMIALGLYAYGGWSLVLTMPISVVLIARAFETQS